LKALQAQLPDLPRSGVGIALKDWDPLFERHVAPRRERHHELVIADFDQDGGLLPRFGDLAAGPVISKVQFMARTGPEILLVDLDGRLGVRKYFRDRRRFVQELEALLCLEGRDCPIPRIMNVDWDRHSVTTSFVPGDVVRELLASAGANIRDRDLRRAFSRSDIRKRIRIGRDHVSTTLSAEQIGRIAAGLERIHSAGFVLEDIKFGNIILEASSGEPIFIDLERALPLSGVPARLADYLKQIDFGRFRQNFGNVPPVHAAADR
jgi:hypothetical protein